MDQTQVKNMRPAVVTARHETARRLAEIGIPVFPCRLNAKEPATTHGLLDRSIDIAVIDKWWGEADWNIGVVPEDAGWAVVDLDVKGDGIGHWAGLPGEKPATYTVATASGGRHLYFAGSLPPSASKIAPGVDTRGRGSYVLYPPSVVLGVTYKVVDETLPAPLPGWVKETVDRPVEKKKVVETEIELDLPENIDRALGYLSNVLNQEGPWGEEDPPDTYRIAARLKDYGISPEQSVDMLVEPIGEAEREWLYRVVENVWRYGQNDPGCYTDRGKYGDPTQYLVEDEPQVEAAPVAYPAIWRASALLGLQFEPPQWVWQDRLLAYKPNLLTGDSGTGKTTLLENIAVAVASGIPLLGAETRRMPVFLLVGEDEYGPVRDNLAAIRHAMQAPDGTLDDVHILSTESDDVPGGHCLVRIDDNGHVTDTPFMRDYVAPWLASFDGPVLWCVDPLEEFAAFNRLNDDASRALSTTWLRSVTRMGRITPLVADHPSAAGMASGRHYAGSAQMRAAFPFFSTLIGGEWSGSGAGRQRKLTLKGMKARYAAEDKVEFYRTAASPAFALNGAPGHTAKDHARQVYQHILERLQAGERTGRDNRSDYGPAAVAYALGVEQREVERAMSVCRAQHWLTYDLGGGKGGKDRTPQGWVPGHVTPIFEQETISY